MQVAEQDLPIAQQGQLCRLRLLYLEDQVGFINRCRIGTDAGAGGFVGGIRKADGLTGAALNQDLVAGAGELRHTRRRGGHPVFLLLDLLRDTDAHVAS